MTKDQVIEALSWAIKMVSAFPEETLKGLTGLSVPYEGGEVSIKLVEKEVKDSEPR